MSHDQQYVFVLLCEEPVGVGEVLCEAQRSQLMDRTAPPLDVGADSMLFEVMLEIVAVIGLDLVILVYVEVVGVGVRWRREDQFRHIGKPLSVERRKIPTATDHVRIVF